MNHSLINDFHIDIEHLHLHARTIGNISQDKPTLVFLHEGLGSIAQWKDFPQLLAQQTQLSAFLYERKGYGKSSPAREKRTPLYMHQEAVLLENVLKKQGILHPIFIGHSDGGTIALLYHSKEIQPLSIVTLAAHVFVEEITIQGIQKAATFYQTTSLPEKLKKYHFDQTDDLFWAWVNIWLSSEFRDWNIIKDIYQVSCPVLVLQGENDEYGSMAQLEAIEQAVSGPAQIQMISNCAHSPHLEAKSIVLDLISNFIKGVKGA